MVRLGEPEAADPLAGGEARKVLLALRLGAVGVDRVHDEGALHAHRAAVAAVDALDLARHEAVADVVDAGAAVALDGRAEQAERAHLVHDLAVEALEARRHQHARLQARLAVLAGRVADRALLVAELVLEAQGVVPLEGGFHGQIPQEKRDGP